MTKSKETGRKTTIKKKTESSHHPETLLERLEQGHSAFTADYFKGAKTFVKILKELIEQTLAGTDISPLSEKLIESLRSCNNVSIMKPISFLLTIHTLKAQDWSLLEGFLVKKKYCSYFLEGLLEASEKGCDIRPSFPTVFSLLSGTSAADAAVPPRSASMSWLGVEKLKYVLGKFVESAPQELLPIVESLLSQKQAHFFVPGLLQEIALWRGEDVSSVLEVATPLLKHEDKKLRRDMVGIYRLAAEAGVDLGLVAKALVARFADEFPIVAERAACSLAIDALNKNDFDSLDRWLSHPNESVQFGLLMALTIAFVNSGRSSTDCNRREADDSGGKADENVVSRIAPFLLSDSEKLQKRAAEAFRRAHDREVEYELSAETLSLLLAQENQRDFLAAHVGENKEKAKALLACAESKPAKGHSHCGGLTELLDHCQLIVSGEKPFTCKRCQQLATTDLKQIFKVGKGLRPALSRKNEVQEQLVHCPHCQAHYIWSYVVEIDVNSEVEHWSLIEQPPTALRDSINYEETIKTYQKRLQGLDPFERQRAAWALTHHYCEQKEWPPLAGLLKHRDLSVGQRCLDTLLQLWPQACFSELQMVANTKELLHCGKGELESRASKLLAAFCLQERREKELLGLLSDSTPTVLEGALSAFSLHKIQKKNYQESIASLRTHADEKVRQEAVEQSKKWVTAEELSDELQDQRADVRQAALRGMRKLADVPDTLLRQCAELLQDRECADCANTTLRKLQAHGADISFALVALSQLATESWCEDKYDVFWTLNEALEAGCDVTPTFANVALLLWDEDCVSSAAPFLRDAGKEGFDLSEVAEELESALPEMDDGYSCEAVTEALTKHFYALGESAALARLADDANKRNWYTFCRVLEEELLPEGATAGWPDLWSERADLSSRVAKLLELARLSLVR